MLLAASVCWRVNYKLKCAAFETQHMMNYVQMMIMCVIILLLLLLLLLIINNINFPFHIVSACESNYTRSYVVDYCIMSGRYSYLSKIFRHG